MNKKTVLLIACITVLCTAFVQSQTITNPNYALKSHETLSITKIEITQKSTNIFLTVENRIEGGNFCADKNIFLIYPNGTPFKLISSKGIPVCPDTHLFNAIGEKLSFVLMFPPLKNGIQSIDLKEDCQENCFSFHGVCLNNNLNKLIDDASVLAENGDQAKALVSFNKIASSNEIKGSGIEGLIFMNIIELSKQTGKLTEAGEWYKKLKSSAIPHTDLYINHLNAEGIVF